MKLALSWLADYVKSNISTDNLVDRLVMTCAEVEAVQTAPEPVNEAVVAKIITISPHPNADRLSLVKIDTGSAEPTVVCGAKNINVGDKVPYLKTGAHYFDQADQLQTLKAATIRGVKSHGMLASEHDLGLSGEHSGILLLADDSRVGTNLARSLGFNKEVLDLEITPNRGDLQSYLGLAREISFITKTRLLTPNIKGFTIAPENSQPLIKTEVKSKNCQRYVTVTMDKLENKPSPAWLQNRLLLNGISSINAIVDVTNYVMLEYGQPMHAFDWHKLGSTGNTKPDLTVREAKDKESIVTLDQSNLTLDKKDLVISNNGQAIAVAGIIGGQSTSVELTTNSIVIEAAIFNPTSTRETARRLGVRTESLVRFEKGLDETMTILALKRAVGLIKDICGGRLVGRLADINQTKTNKEKINVALDRAERVLGLKLDHSKVKQNLSSIGFSVSTTSQNHISVLVPPWRKDVTIEEDIYEEIVRLQGFDQLPATMPSGDFYPQSKDFAYSVERRLRESLLKFGWRDVVNQAFMSTNLVGKYSVNQAQLVEVANPLSSQEQYVRVELLPILIEHLAKESRRVEGSKIAEIGHVFQIHNGKIVETSHLALAQLTNDPAVAARQLKQALVLAVTGTERGVKVTFKTTNPKQDYFANQTEQILFNDLVVGELGQLTASLTNQSKIRGSRFIIGAEVDLSPLTKQPLQPLFYQRTSRFPAITRDFNLTLAAQAVGALVKEVERAKVKNLQSVELLDVYVDNDKRVATLRLTLQSNNHTLTQAEADQALTAVKNLLHAK